MLHAEIHGKVGDDLSRTVRLEDVLTSTVFGTLFVAGIGGGGDRILKLWLRKARTPGWGQLEVEEHPVDWYSFWPQLE